MLRCLLVLLIWRCAETMMAQTAPARVPLQTEIVVPLDVSRLREGMTVYVRVNVAWSEGACVLRTGSLVRAHVVSIVRHSKISKRSELELSFESGTCASQQDAPMSFELVGIIGPPEGVRSDQSGVSESPPLADAIGN